MSASEPTEQRVNLEYQGATLRTMLWLLIVGVVSSFIIPAAWAIAWLYRRILSQVSFSDGTRVAFRGRAGQIWGWFVFVVILYWVPTLVGGIVYNGNPFSLILLSQDLENAIDAGDSTVMSAYFSAVAVGGGLGIVVTLISLYVQLVIIRWAIAGIELNDGPELYFSGRYLRLLGWLLLYSVSFITIIGWAWVGTAYLRWFARNVEGIGIRLEFVGSGWGLLWRVFGIGVVTASLALAIIVSPVVGILLVIWYLWAAIWLFRWLVRNVVLVRPAPSPGIAAPDM